MGVTSMCGAGMKQVNLDFHHVVWEKHCLNRLVRTQVNYNIATDILSCWVHKIFLKHFLVRLHLYRCYPPYYKLQMCIDLYCTGASSTEVSQAGGKQEEEVFISIQAFPALLDVSPSCDIMAVSCGSRHTAAVTSKKRTISTVFDAIWHCCFY